MNSRRRSARNARLLALLSGSETCHACGFVMEREWRFRGFEGRTVKVRVGISHACSLREIKARSEMLAARSAR